MENFKKVKQSKEMEQLIKLSSDLNNIDLRIFRPQDIRVLATAFEHLDLVITYYSQDKPVK